MTEYELSNLVYQQFILLIMAYALGKWSRGSSIWDFLGDGMAFVIKKIKERKEGR